MFIFGMALIPLFSKILMVSTQNAHDLHRYLLLYRFLLDQPEPGRLADDGRLRGSGWGMQKFGFSQAALCIALILAQ